MLPRLRCIRTTMSVVRLGAENSCSATQLMIRMAPTGNLSSFSCEFFLEPHLLEALDQESEVGSRRGATEVRVAAGLPLGLMKEKTFGSHERSPRFMSVSTRSYSAGSTRSVSSVLLITP